MPTVESDISIGETGDVSIGDLHFSRRLNTIMELAFISGSTPHASLERI